MLLKKIKAMNNVKLDFLHIEEASSTNEDIFMNKKYKPTLNNYSRFLVSFDDATTTSHGIVDVALGYTFSVYREIEDSNQLMYVAHLGEGGLSMTDFNVVNGVKYKYYIFKEDESSISEAVMSNSVETCWWDWSLVDLMPNPHADNYYYADTDNVWKFNLNVSSATTNQTMSVSTYDNLTRYPKVSIGKSNYSNGSLTCLLGNLQKTNNGGIEYIENATMREEWNTFCANGNIKLLKDRKGNALLVSITSTSADTDDILREQANTITFNWVEVGSTKNITIIGI